MCFIVLLCFSRWYFQNTFSSNQGQKLKRKWNCLIHKLFWKRNHVPWCVSVKTFFIIFNILKFWSWQRSRVPEIPDYYWEFKNPKEKVLFGCKFLCETGPKQMQARTYVRLTVTEPESAPWLCVEVTRFPQSLATKQEACCSSP